jgi:hypothetical protein
MESSKMKKFEEKEIKKLSSLNLNETELGKVKGGIILTLNWDGWFDGSLFKRLNINEFDKP